MAAGQGIMNTKRSASHSLMLGEIFLTRGLLWAASRAKERMVYVQIEHDHNSCFDAG
jgi:hypothetical protein